MSRNRTCIAALLAMALVLSVGCSGEIGDVGDAAFPDASMDVGDVGVGIDGFVIPAECGEAGTAIVYFETSCAAIGACHQSGGQFPDLTRAGLPLLESLSSEANPGERLLIPSDPEASWLYRKMADTQGAEGGGVMPAGRRSDWATLPDDVVAIRDWINAGAPTVCDELPPTGGQVDPNTLDRDAIFTCADPSAPRSSPGRLRRIEREEFTHMVSRRLDGQYTAVIENPLVVPVRHEYPTYTEDVSISAGALNLMLLILPEATALLRTGTGGGRMSARPITSAELRCIFNEAEPDDACIDAYVDVLLTRGTSFTEPSDWTRTHTRELMVRALGREASIDDRQDTLDFVIQATLLTRGALFRDELAGAPGERARLSNSQLGLALGRLLSTHPPGSLKTDYHSILLGDPDNDVREEGWLAAIAAAAEIPRAPWSTDQSRMARSPRRKLRRRRQLGRTGEVDPGATLLSEHSAALPRGGGRTASRQRTRTERSRPRSNRHRRRRRCVRDLPSPDELARRAL